MIASQNIFQFERYTDEDGLSQNVILDICRDQKGFLWIASYTGLNRFDGYGFKIYTKDTNNPNSISSNRIRTIFEDSAGQLWIGSDGGGLNNFNRETETFTHYTHNPKDSTSICHNRINCIAEDLTCFANPFQR